MKSSKKVFLASLCGVFGILVVLLFMGKTYLAEQTARDEPVELEYQNYNTKKIHISKVAHLDLKGQWQARIVQGEKADILVKGPGDLLAELTVSRRGDLVRLHSLKKSKDRRLYLDMTAPLIRSLRVRGVAEVFISGFSLENLYITCEGVTRLKGKDGRAENLSYTAKGVTNVDLTSFPVHSANLICKGVTHIDLAMTGGELSGRVEGTGHVNYRGEAGRNSIQVQGACSITQI